MLCENVYWIISEKWKNINKLKSNDEEHSLKEMWVLSECSTFLLINIMGGLTIVSTSCYLRYLLGPGMSTVLLL